MAAAALARTGARNGWAPRRSASPPTSQRARAAVKPMINNISVAVPEFVNWGAKVNSAPPAMVTLKSTRVGGTMPHNARRFARKFRAAGSFVRSGVAGSIFGRAPGEPDRRRHPEQGQRR